MNSGIYKIVNNITGDIYVGSAVDIKRRFRKHKSDLNLHRHPNIILQRAFDKYGEVNLLFDIIECVNNKNNLIVKEQHYIDTLNPKYNILKIAGSRLGHKSSEETKQKLSKILLGNKRTLGYKNSEETILKHSKTFKVLSPKGDIISGTNFRKFCLDNNLDASHMYKVFNGKLNHHKGWTKVINKGEK